MSVTVYIYIYVPHKVTVDDECSLCDPDVGSNNSGFYELSAVLTHKGRSSSSGHYVAWVRKKGGKCARLRSQGSYAVIKVLEKFEF